MFRFQRLARAFSAGATFLVAGCTAQLNSNTLDMQASYKGLLMKQVLYNLSEALDDPTFFPSQILIGGGGAQTVNTITPSMTVPLPTSTITGAVAAGATTTVTNTTATNLGNAGFGISFADSWQLSWILSPRTDPDELRRLRALYRYGAGMTPDDCTGGRDGCFKEEYVMQGGKTVPNPVFTQEPSCVLCGPGPSQSALKVNDKLRKLNPLITKKSDEGHKIVKTYGGMSFYVSSDEDFTNFVLFVLEAMSNAAVPSYQPPKAEPNASTLGTKSGPAPAQYPAPPKVQFQTPYAIGVF